MLGYNWMINGVWRSTYSRPVRGGAKGTAFDYQQMRDAPLIADREYSEEEFWDNYEYFIRRVLPVAEAENVKLAIHPNDPLQIKPWGQKEFSLLDPDHNLLTFGQSV